jgi:myo-inositol-1(or 4)-monophosphatase
MNLKNITQLLIDCIIDVGEYIKSERLQFSYSDVEIKGLNDLVSYVDKESERMLVQKLSNILPKAGFVTEENTKNENQDYNWIIDPLDGTTNFIHGIPHFAISVALEFKGEIIIGVVYEINRKECFSAFLNGGAFLNGEKISVSNREHLSESVIATGFPIYNFSKIDSYIQTLIFLMKNTHGIRRMGAASLDLCYVACGRMDAFFEYNLKPWDVAAGSLIIKESGGKVFDFRGENNWLYGAEIVATNSKIKEEFENVIKLNFK